MNKLAHFTTRRHWWVLAAWVALIAVVSLLSAGLGGADYRDSFTLAHTETAKVTSLLKESGQSGQSGQSGYETAGTSGGRSQRMPPMLRLTVLHETS